MSGGLALRCPAWGRLLGVWWPGPAAAPGWRVELSCKHCTYSARKGGPAPPVRHVFDTAGQASTIN
jgi:hypothetical protein